MDAEVWYKNILPQHMNSVLVELWDASKVYTRNIIRDSFVKINLPPIRPHDYITNTQSCAAFIEVSYVPKAE